MALGLSGIGDECCLSLMADDEGEDETNMILDCVWNESRERGRWSSEEPIEAADMRFAKT